MRKRRVREGKDINTASCKSVFYMEHLIYHLLRDVVTVHIIKPESKTSTCEIHLSLASISFSIITIAVTFSHLMQLKNTRTIV